MYNKLIKIEISIYCLKKMLVCILQILSLG